MILSCVLHFILQSHTSDRLIHLSYSLRNLSLVFHIPFSMNSLRFIHPSSLPPSLPPFFPPSLPSFLSPEIVFYFAFILSSLTGYRILSWQAFFLSILFFQSFFCLLVSVVSIQNSDVVIFVFPLNMPFVLTAFSFISAFWLWCVCVWFVYLACGFLIFLKMWVNVFHWFWKIFFNYFIRYFCCILYVASLMGL